MSDKTIREGDKDRLKTDYCNENIRLRAVDSVTVVSFDGHLLIVRMLVCTLSVDLGYLMLINKDSPK